MGCNESGRCAEKRFFCFPSSPSFFREGRKRVARPAATYSNRERPTDRPPLLRRLDTCQSPRETCPEQFRVSTSLSLSLSLPLHRCEHRRSIFHRVTRATVARKAILRWRNTPFACVRGERERERERESEKERERGRVVAARRGRETETGRSEEEKR